MFLRTTAQGTHQSVIPGIPIEPTGEQITWTVLEVFRFNDSRMVERWAIHDLREQVTAVGQE